MVVLNATFDIGGEQKVDWKWYSWVGQAMQFPRFEFFFSRCQRSSMSTTSTSLLKPALSHQNLIIFLVHSNGFFDDERRNQLFHGICAARYWNHVKTVGLWAWRNQNVTKTLGFYGGFKRNVWHRRWAKGGLKMVFVSRPGHAVSLFWGFFFKVPEVFHVHNFHKSCKTTIIISKPYIFFSAFKWFFWWWAEKSAFPWYLSGKVLESCQNCPFMGVKKPKRDQNPRFL